MGDHPALGEHDQNPHGRWHQPVGLFGDDAKYTLAGRKIVVLLLSSVLQKIKRTLDTANGIFCLSLKYMLI